jgi:hypothetical protein
MSLNVDETKTRIARPLFCGAPSRRADVRGLDTEAFFAFFSLGISAWDGGQTAISGLDASSWIDEGEGDTVGPGGAPSLDSTRRATMAKTTWLTPAVD